MKQGYLTLLILAALGAFLFASSWYLAADDIWWWWIPETTGGTLLLACLFGLPVNLAYYMYRAEGGREPVSRWMARGVFTAGVAVFALSLSIELVVAPLIPGCPLSDIGSYCVPRSILWAGAGISGGVGLFSVWGLMYKRPSKVPANDVRRL
ncbi:MAG: hypothetical protein JRN35_08145 [Nitrososphaerota archaeon]|nr:hypothetical protein [Nitrososphaerota archaeon]